jgi:hypothetical protein
MTHDQIDRMVRQANPVPDLKVLEPVDASVLVLDQQRRTDMQTHDRVQVEQVQEKPRRGVLIGIAAAAAIAIGVLALVQTGDDAPVADQPVVTEATTSTAEAVEVATGFVEAYAAYDADKAAPYLAANASVNLESGADLPLGARWAEAQGLKVLLDSCEAVGSSSSATRVRCTYDYHAIRSDEMGLGPFSGSWIDFNVAEGKIVSASDNIVFEEEFSPQVWEPFAAWVAENHPDDVLVMYEDGSQSSQRITEDSIPVWEQRTREYVAFVNAQG